MKAQVDSKRAVGGSARKPPKAKVQAKRLVAKKAPKRKGSKDLESGKRLAAALEREKAIGEILRVMSVSPGDVQPVLEAVAERAAYLCDAPYANVWIRDGEMLRPSAFSRLWERTSPLPVPLTRGSVNGRAVLDRKIVHHADIVPLLDTEYPDARQNVKRLGFRAILGVPLLREGEARGTVTVFRREPRPFSPEQIALVETFARQAVIAIENVRLFNETKEALEQQTATSEILRVISRSPTDVQPVFDAIAGAALRLCSASSTAVLTFDGKLMRLAALLANVSPEEAEALRLRYPMSPGRQTAGSRAILTGSTVVVPDVLEDPEFESRARTFRSVVSVPLMREGIPIGAITVGRPEPGEFPEKQIALLQTFADQAVIAIENVRLFNETREALERQTATAEILKVISGSPTDTQPVFDAIVQSAAGLFRRKAALRTVEGGGLKRRSRSYADDGEFHGAEWLPIDRDSLVGRAVIECRAIQVSDTHAADAPPYTRSHATQLVFRSIASAPLVRDGKAIGVLSVSSPEPGAMSDKQMQLLATFADQAVIAIENVRLFNETKEALERQTATSEILRVISQSPRDVQPVFDTIVGAALRLCNAASANLFTFDGKQLHLGAYAREDTAPDPAGDLRGLRTNFPRPPGRELAGPRAVLTCSVVSIPDVLSDDEYAFKEFAVAGGFRSALAVPLVRNGAPIGALVVGRSEPGQFPDKQLALLQTFADQAVIAIENVRLFTELEARTLQLTRSVGELRALGEVGQAVSSTLDLETVLSTIVSRAVQLAGMDGGSIWEYDEGREQFYVRATDGQPDELVEVQRATPIRKGEGALGRLALTAEPVEIRDIADESSYQSRFREILIQCGYRSVLAVPLLREDHLLGALAVTRTTPGEFAPVVTALLKTFATQSALAIQNARLYREIEVKSKELEAASRHKSEFLANMSHELRTPLNAIIGFSEVLSERMFGEINQKQAEYIGDILQSGQHLLSLINDILDLSKIEAGRMDLELSDFDLPGTIESTLTLVRERAVRRGIALGRGIDERLGKIRADERKVKQVLLNLLSNALKFTPEGGKIDVRAAVTDGAAEISVTDTGVGIAPEDQATVFEEFRQVGTASKKVEGTGLGLAISRKFIELHGGKIWVTSQVGTGSTFAFTLPLR